MIKHQKKIHPVVWLLVIISVVNASMVRSMEECDPRELLNHAIEDKQLRALVATLRHSFGSRADGIGSPRSNATQVELKKIRGQLDSIEEESLSDLDTLLLVSALANQDLWAITVSPNSARDLLTFGYPVFSTFSNNISDLARVHEPNDVTHEEGKMFVILVTTQTSLPSLLPNPTLLPELTKLFSHIGAIANRVLEINRTIIQPGSSIPSSAIEVTLRDIATWRVLLDCAQKMYPNVSNAFALYEILINLARSEYIVDNPPPGEALNKWLTNIQKTSADEHCCVNVMIDALKPYADAFLLSHECLPDNNFIWQRKSVHRQLSKEMLQKIESSSSKEEEDLKGITKDELITATQRHTVLTVAIPQQTARYLLNSGYSVFLRSDSGDIVQIHDPLEHVTIQNGTLVTALKKQSRTNASSHAQAKNPFLIVTSVLAEFIALSISTEKNAENDSTILKRLGLIASIIEPNLHSAFVLYELFKSFLVEESKIEETKKTKIRAHRKSLAISCLEALVKIIEPCAEAFRHAQQALMLSREHLHRAETQKETSERTEKSRPSKKARQAAARRARHAHASSDVVTSTPLMGMPTPTALVTPVIPPRMPGAETETVYADQPTKKITTVKVFQVAKDASAGKHQSRQAEEEKKAKRAKQEQENKPQLRALFPNERALFVNFLREKKLIESSIYQMLLNPHATVKLDQNELDHWIAQFCNCLQEFLDKHTIDSSENRALFIQGIRQDLSNRGATNHRETISDYIIRLRAPFIAAGLLSTRDMKDVVTYNAVELSAYWSHLAKRKVA